MMVVKGPRLKLRDVRRVFRLVAEIRRLGDDPNQWRPFMVKELVGLFNVELVVSSEIYAQRTGTNDVWDIVDIGWGADAGGQTWRIESTTRETNPQVFDILVRDPERDDDDRVPIAPAERMHEGSRFILSNQALPHISAVDQLGIHRGHDAPEFNAADHRLLRLLHVELGRFWRADVLESTRDPQRNLAPRLRQTLDELTSGKSEKQIALALHISQHTVHNYVKALHQRFKVSSRGELLAVASRAEKQFVPRLSRDAE